MLRGSWLCGVLLLLEHRCGPAAPERVQPRLLAPPPVVAPAGVLRHWLTAPDTSRADQARGLSAGPAVRAFYRISPAPAWVAADHPLPVADSAWQVLHRARTLGLEPAWYHVPRLQLLRDSLQRPTAARARQLAELELLLTDGVLRLLQDAGRGRLHAFTPSAAEQAAGRAGQPAQVLRAALAGPGVAQAVQAVQPRHRPYRQLQQALARWLQLPVAPAAAARRDSLFQVAALSLERWRWQPLPEGAYLLVNLPAQELYAIRADSVERRHRVIIGTAATPTPTLSSTIRYFTVAPEWRVPTSIATREMLPRLRQDAGYLQRNNLRLYDAQGHQRNPATIDWRRVAAAQFPYTIRQAAGCDNALGNVVFRFDNPYDVYLHDTPARELFARPGRALSHGCVRVEKPLALAAYLLRQDGQLAQLPPEDACTRQPQPRNYPLRHPVPLYLHYATCAAEAGQLRFYPDVYHLDQPLLRALFPATAAE